jgi:putative ABC transport system permease protein
MIKNYFRIAWRNLARSKGYSLINIGGLAVGMAVAMLIGLWIWDECTYDRYNKHYDRIAQLRQNQNFNGSIDTWQTMPYPMGPALQNEYGSYFKQIVRSSWLFNRTAQIGEKRVKILGRYMDPQGPDLMDVQMIEGTKNCLNDFSSILVSQNTAKDLFGSENPMGKTVTLDNREHLVVKGIYKDLPDNSSFSRNGFIASFEMYAQGQGYGNPNDDHWGNNAFLVYVQIADNTDFASVSRTIKDLKLRHISADDRRFQPALFLHPMSRWRLYNDFRNGVNVGGAIEFVWMFGIIGVFVLMLACINFMNLSTARSEKRAKEVGIRKAIGSFRTQLVAQFFSESLLVVAFGFICSVMLVQLLLPLFNNVASKKVSIMWSNPLFWLVGIVITLLTALVAGSYPAFYLSSFQPVKVLKGTFKTGRFAAIPRKILVVVQFTVSLTLIIGTIVVFRQIQYAMTRPVGYDRSGLLSFEAMNADLSEHLDAIKSELQASGLVLNVSRSSAPVTSVWSTNGGFNWRGKDPSQAVDFPNTGVSSEYASTIGWQLKQGHTFSATMATDSLAFVINEAAARFLGFKDPIGEIMDWDGRKFTIIGVIKDVVNESPYEPVRASLYHLGAVDAGSIINVRINPAKSTTSALAEIEKVFKKYSPHQPFDYRFVDEEYGRKFRDEQRIGKLAGFFAILAIFISCLGLFGMASFMAERRTKEIGVRKVLGASVFNLWGLLSKDFLLLVFIALLIATPLAWYLMRGWLDHYSYRSGIAWWIFAVSGAGMLIITLLTVSFQSIKAALMNPVNSLKAE